MKHYLFLIILCLLSLSSIFAQLTLPFNPAKISNDSLYYVGWKGGMDIASFSFNSPSLRVAGLAVDEQEEPQFFVVQTQANNWGASLHAFDLNGNQLTTEAMFGLFREVQILQVPGQSEEWYIIYGGEPGVITFAGNAAYTPNHLRYSRVSYDGTNLVFIEKDVVIEAEGIAQTYLDGKAVSFNLDADAPDCAFSLYALRRTTSSTDYSMDRFTIDGDSIYWSANTGNLSVPVWNWGFAASPIEVSPRGKEVAVCNRNTSTSAYDIVVFDAVNFVADSAKLITLDELIVQADNVNTFSSMPMNEAIAALPYLNQFSFKVQSIEFSFLGRYLYFAGGGNQISGNPDFRSYLGQIDLASNPPYDLRLQVQEEGTNYNTWTRIVELERCYDGNVYFTKTNSETLFVVPNPEELMPHSLTPTDVDLSIPNTQNITLAGSGPWVTFLDPIDGYSYLTNVNCLPPPDSTNLCLETKILLEGAYENGGTMGSELIDFIPATQPYNAPPYNYSGTETIDSISSNVVDWVLVELRSGAPSLTTQNTIVVETKAGLLLDSGDIVGVDGYSPLCFDSLSLGDEYYVCIRHRNHLDVLSAEPIVATTNTMFYDFTTNETTAWGIQQLKEIEPGFWAMFAGDYTQDGTIQTTDYDLWVTQPAAIGVYEAIDGNLDGVIQITDYDIWFANKSKLGSVEIGF